MTRRRQIYEGMRQNSFQGSRASTIVQYFKDDATAFNNEKEGMIVGKGVLNNRISEFMMLKLAEIGIPTHFVRRLNMREQLVLEGGHNSCRSSCPKFSAGQFSQRFKMDEGTPLPRSIVEYCYKSRRTG